MTAPGMAAVAPAYHRGPDRLAEHLLWTALVVAGLALVYLLVWWGWRRRAALHADLPQLPGAAAAKAQPALLPPLPGLYVGTTLAGQWLERVVARGLSRRGKGHLVLTAEGVVVERAGEPDFLIPATAVTGARTDRAIAGTVVAADALLVIGWRHGGLDLETGFRADDRLSSETGYTGWLRALGSLETTTIQEVAQ